MTNKCIMDCNAKKLYIIRLIKSCMEQSNSNNSNNLTYNEHSVEGISNQRCMQMDCISE